jgi:hypothetical protein
LSNKSLAFAWRGYCGSIPHLHSKTLLYVTELECLWLQQQKTENDLYMAAESEISDQERLDSTM